MFTNLAIPNWGTTLWDLWDGQDDGFSSGIFTWDPSQQVQQVAK
jgi:hypothetical protein